jgi:hypothetical protein
VSTALALEGQYEIDSITALCDRAMFDLNSARSAAEVLEARDRASFAYDLAKKARRINKAREAHDTVIESAHRVQARALEIESQAKIRLAEEYDAAQERGEVQRHSRVDILEGNIKPPTQAEIGVSAKQIHEARQFRDAERNDPGVISRAINGRLNAGEEPTKAYLRGVVNEAAIEALQGRGGARRDRSNPIHKPNPALDAVFGLNGSASRIVEIIQECGSRSVLDGCTDAAMRIRSVALLTKCRDILNEVLEYGHA